MSPRAIYTDSGNMLTASYSLSWPRFKQKIMLQRNM